MTGILAGCAGPAEKFAERAHEHGFLRDDVAGTRFTHVSFRNRVQQPGRTVHVYLGGDGTPWVASRPARDPTPRVPLVLDLMALDRSPAIYLGRPCYHGMSRARDCNGWLWTNGRYAERVVASMASALGRVLARHRYARAVLIGHSGGGALAMLLAPRVPQTIAVVTIGANLDIDAWTDFRGFGRLAGSLNPARQSPLTKSISQFHFAGAKDRVVPPHVVKAGLRHGADLVVVEGYDHECCWTSYWPQVLARLSRIEASDR